MKYSLNNTEIFNYYHHRKGDRGEREGEKGAILKLDAPESDDSCPNSSNTVTFVMQGGSFLATRGE